MEMKFFEQMSPVAEISCGDCHTVFRLQNGQVFSLGRNDHGELGLGDFVDRTIPEQVTALAHEVIVKIEAGEVSCTVLTNNGKLYTWGST